MTMTIKSLEAEILDVLDACDEAEVERAYIEAELKTVDRVDLARELHRMVGAGVIERVKIQGGFAYRRPLNGAAPKAAPAPQAEAPAVSVEPTTKAPQAETSRREKVLAALDAGPLDLPAIIAATGVPAPKAISTLQHLMRAHAVRKTGARRSYLYHRADAASGPASPPAPASAGRPAVPKRGFPSVTAVGKNPQKGIPSGHSGSTTVVSSLSPPGRAVVEAPRAVAPARAIGAGDPEITGQPTEEAKKLEFSLRGDGRLVFRINGEPSVFLSPGDSRRLFHFMTGCAGVFGAAAPVSA